MAAIFLAVIALSGVILKVQLLLHGGHHRPGAGPAMAGPPPVPQGFDARLHEFLFELHTGEIFGLTGDVFSILCGIALLVLCVTGLKIYFDMFVRRAKSGLKALFWR